MKMRVLHILQKLGAITCILFAILYVLLAVYHNRRKSKFIFQVWNRFTLKMFFEVLTENFLILPFTYLLTQIPGLKYGWLNLFFGMRDRFFPVYGNLALMPIIKGLESQHEIIKLTAIFFLLIFLFLLPIFAKGEEDDDRKGFEDWGSITKQSFKFGFTHCILNGVSIAAGIGISVTGLFLGYHYQRVFKKNARKMGRVKARREAIMISTTYHAMSNIITAGVFLAYAISLL